MTKIIAAVDQHWGIGYQGKILEHIPEDLQFFKSMVFDTPVVVGRKTYESLPKKVIGYFGEKFVITNQKQLYGWWDGALYTTLEDAQNRVYFDDLAIIGGASIYKAWLPKADLCFLTHIYKEHENVDAYFPALDEDEWECIARSDIHYFGDIPYQFKTYNHYKYCY